MSLLSRIANLFSRAEIDRGIEDELRSHLEMRIEDNMAAGMTREAAERDARLRFGNPVTMKERTVEKDAATALDAVGRDVRYALRGFAKSPGFTAVAILTLALGIGANTAIFQLVDAVRLQSLPIAHPQELAEVKIVGGNRGFGVSQNGYTQLTRPVWGEIRRHHDPFSGVFAWKMNDQLLGEPSDARHVTALEVSGGFFHVLGVRPWQGRLIGPEDEPVACASPRAVVSWPFWQAQMGGRALTPGTTLKPGTMLKLDNQPFEVVGVTPPGFFGMAVGESFDVAEVLPVTPCEGGEWERQFFDVSVMGRLKPGWTMKQASSYFDAISPGIFQEVAPTGYSAQEIKIFTGFRMSVSPASGGVSELRKEYDESLTLLLAITGLVLLIACANLANLMLARASARGREMAVRTALGASRGRLIRQMLIESGMLALTGTMLGVALAQGFSRFLVSSLSTREWQVKLPITTDWRVLLFAAGVAALTCVIFGTIPALRASNADPVTAMKTGDGRLAGHRERFSVQRLMVVTQIAVSMVLLVGALLFVRSFRNLMTIDPGMREHGITIVHLGFPTPHVEPEQRAAVKQRLVDDIRGIPGVTNAASTTNDPLLGASWGHQVRVGAMQAGSRFTWVSPEYFRTMNIPLLAGRNFAETDRADAPRVAIVNQAFVRQFAGELAHGANPLGVTMRTLPEPNYPETVLEIVGTIPDTKYNDIREETPPMAFVPAAQFPVAAAGPWVSIMAASDEASANVMADIKRAMAEKHPGVIVEMHNFETQVRDRLLRERLMAILSGFFGGLAALLVMVGLYGVISYFVTLRRSEIGVRIALGASRRQVVGLVMRDAAWMLAAGAAAGTVLSLLAGRGAGSMLYGLKAYDPATLAFAAALLAAIAALASWLPARRASRLDPMTALRCE